MDAFTVAAEILGAIELSAEQRAQLRALNRGLAQRLFSLRRAPGAAGHRELTRAEVAELRQMLEAEILALLTPAQRRLLLRSE